jgi:hypothetical protein
MDPAEPAQEPIPGRPQREPGWIARHSVLLSVSAIVVAALVLALLLGERTTSGSTPSAGAVAETGGDGWDAESIAALGFLTTVRAEPGLDHLTVSEIIGLGESACATLDKIGAEPSTILALYTVYAATGIERDAVIHLIAASVIALCPRHAYALSEVSP